MLSVVRPSFCRPSLIFHIFDFSSEIAKQNPMKLDRKPDLNVLYQVCVFQADQKNKMAALASDWLRDFDFSSETADRNSPKIDRIRASRKNKMAALPSDWLRHFGLLLWNRRTEFNETWQNARSQHALPSLCFWGRLEKQNGHSGLWLAVLFLSSPLKQLNGIQRHLTGSNI